MKLVIFMRIKGKPIFISERKHGPLLNKTFEICAFLSSCASPRYILNVKRNDAVGNVNNVTLVHILFTG